MKHSIGLRIVLVTFLLMLGCSSDNNSISSEPEQQLESQQAEVEKALKEETPKEQPRPQSFTQPSFADAMNYQRPQGIVAGIESPTDIPLQASSSDEFLQEAVSYAEDMQSYALLVWHQGELILERYFDEHDRTLRSESASMHKSVLALAFITAVRDGHINSVDEPVGAYIPEWRDDARGAIRIRDLLTMSSGLRPLSSEGGPASESVQFFMDAAKAREKILSLELVDEPGTVFDYENTSSQLLGLILETATGQRYEDYLSQSLWQPLGLDKAYVWYNEPDGFPKTYTALLAKPQDWLKLGLLVKDRGQYNGEQLLPAELIDSMTTASAANEGYGWQTWIGVDRVGRRYYNETQTGLSVAQTEPFTLNDWIYFDGFGGQRVYVSRGSDLIIVRMGEVRMDWDESTLPNAVVRALNN